MFKDCNQKQHIIFTHISSAKASPIDKMDFTGSRGIISFREDQNSEHQKNHIIYSNNHCLLVVVLGLIVVFFFITRMCVAFFFFFCNGHVLHLKTENKVTDRMKSVISYNMVHPHLTSSWLSYILTYCHLRSSEF